MTNNNFTYSSDEQIVGTWHDGKTIYRKCFHLTSFTDGMVIDSELTKTTVETLVNVGGSFKNGVGNMQPFPCKLGSSYIDLYISANGVIAKFYGFGFTGADIIIEYTKS